MVKIALSIIVKNESKILQRCFDSVKKVVDYIHVLDTGSTDNTLQVIESWKKTNLDIDVCVEVTSFVNFAVTRTEALTKTPLAFDDVDYILLLDADMVLVTTPSFDKESLSENAYSLTQHNGNLVYENLRLVKNISGWRYVGVTHEYLENTGVFFHPTQLNDLYIDDISDGGCKKDKFIRDEMLLSAELANLSPLLLQRYTFYLAQTLRDTGRYREAIDKYKVRIALCGSEDEIYYSYYQCGECSYLLGDYGNTLLYMSKAYSIHKRAECLFRIVQYYNDIKCYDIAYFWGKLAYNISLKQLAVQPPPLFTDVQLLKYDIPLQYSVSLYHTEKENYPAFCKKIAETARLDPHCPQRVLLTLENNLHYI